MTIYCITSYVDGECYLSAATTDEQRAEELRLLFSTRDCQSIIEKFEDGESSLDEKLAHVGYNVTLHIDSSTYEIRFDEIEAFTELLLPGQTIEQYVRTDLYPSHNVYLCEITVGARDKQEAKALAYTLAMNDIKMNSDQEVDVCGLI